MYTKIKRAMVYVVVAASSYGMLASAAEENVQMRDPQRWYREDIGPRARYNNMAQEANAAYQQSLNDCRSLRNRELMECRREAKDNFNKDMRRAHRMLERRGGDDNM
ncbi:hypothetical protein [Glaciimonas immobilis]|uniref:Uncharacterized protein n=1 Tax=Glaciimonas immobilis TaxID=728004 RepID=A0A840RVL2_9BURK|nr:hypothetical protein [Glaciimonas immobilis]KAF3997743.1 hypothetical protein HAV38_13910 [Glaciimonas immobilis]MBB5200530.1 hypothetical protein [Glaciimonas immobilis]